MTKEELLTVLMMDFDEMCFAPTAPECIHAEAYAREWKRALVDVLRGYRQQIDDMETVVRCRDCKYWQDNNGGYPHEECRWWKNETPDADDYCSYGERMRGEKE